MAHEIDFSNDRANIAYVGEMPWHGLGKEKQAGESIESWAVDAGLNWEAEQVPAYAFVENDAYVPVTDRYFTRRKDTGAIFSYCSSDRYKLVQPREILEFFDRYVAVDDRFQIEVAGSLRGGEIIWATAKYNGDLTVAGENHRAHILMTTTFDGSGATKNKGTMTRVVCKNTWNTALAGFKNAEVNTRHNTKFNAEQTGKELAKLAQGIQQFKVFGDAMAQVEMTKDELNIFFKQCLGIDPNIDAEEVSQRKLNQFGDIAKAYKRSVEEGAEKNSAWSAFQAVTRYVDHDRSTRAGDDVPEGEARFLSSQIGSGAAFKGKAMELLMPRIKERVPVLVN